MKSNYNKFLINHWKKHCQAKTKPQNSYFNTLYPCIFFFINISAHTHIPEYMHVHKHTDIHR